MSKAFITHQSPNVTAEDLRLLSQHPANSGTNVVALVQRRGPQSFPIGFYISNNGCFYSYHFFAYPIFNAPALYVVETLGLPSAYSFAITNSGFATFALITIFSLRLSHLKRITLAILFLTSGTVFYLRWSHPEVFSASLLMIGLCLAQRQRRELAAVAAALASTQNPPIALATAAFLCWDFYISRRNSGHFMPNGTRLAWWALAVIITLSPSVFYLATFSTPNLIAAKGYANPGLISWARMISVYLDLDQGAVVALPTLLLLPVLFAYNLLSRRSRNDLALATMFVFLSLAICIPSLSTTNWNAGHSVIMRYAYWISIPLLFSLVLLAGDTRKASRLGLCFVIFAQIAICCSHGAFVADSGGLRFSYLARYALARLPGLYYPVPEIFIENGQGHDGAEKKSLYFYVHNRHITKLLYHRSTTLDLKDLSSCAPENLSHTPSIKPMELGWAYADFDSPPRVPLPDGFYQHYRPLTLEPEKPYGPSDQSLFYGGWSASEQTHRWSTGNESVLGFMLPAGTSRDAVLTIDGGFALNRVQPVTIQAGDSVIDSATVAANRITVPVNELPDISGMVFLTFRWEAPLPPSKKDKRAIAFAFRKFTLNSTTHP